ncbi:MAG: hypothetical protein PHY87_10040 [Sphaerochaeta sp.]|nr:hypothetical protein [Sphaerochaeta sp.]
MTKIVITTSDKDIALSPKEAREVFEELAGLFFLDDEEEKEDEETDIMDDTFDPPEGAEEII